MIYLYLFITFFEIGIFGFGGGYGMLSLMQTKKHIRDDRMVGSCDTAAHDGR